MKCQNGTCEHTAYAATLSGLRKDSLELREELAALRVLVPPAENGRNRYGVDVSYFRNLINRELNRGLADFRPDELARVFARMSNTADREVMREKEFIDLAKVRANAIRDAATALCPVSGYVIRSEQARGDLVDYANQIEAG